MLKEVEMPPLLLDSIVNRAGSRCALRAGEPRSRFEINPQAQHPTIGVELRSLDLPGRRQTESDGEERVGVHANTMCCRLDRQLPTDLGKEPEMKTKEKTKDIGHGSVICEQIEASISGYVERVPSLRGRTLAEGDLRPERPLRSLLPVTGRQIPSACLNLQRRRAGRGHLGRGDCRAGRAALRRGRPGRRGRGLGAGGGRCPARRATAVWPPRD